MILVYLLNRWTRHKQQKLRLHRLPENFFGGAGLELLVRDDSGFESLLGVRIVRGRNGVGLSGSFKESVPTWSHILAPPAAHHQARFLRPTNTQQTQREPQRHADYHRPERAQDRNKHRESHFKLSVSRSRFGGVQTGFGDGAAPLLIEPEVSRSSTKSIYGKDATSSLNFTLDCYVSVCPLPGSSPRLGVSIRGGASGPAARGGGISGHRLAGEALPWYSAPGADLYCRRWCNRCPLTVEMRRVLYFLLNGFTFSVDKAA